MTEQIAPQALRFGANYTPSQDWMHAWEDIDADQVRRDFEGLAELGLDHVRLLPLWPILQPNRTLIRSKAVDDVRRVVDIAAEQGLDASVDVIQGHLSSFDYLPAWIQTWHKRNMFTDPEVVAAEAALVTSLGSALKDAPNFLGLTLGNEINQFSGPPHPDPMGATQDQAAQWIETLIHTAKKEAPDFTHLHAEYDAVFFLDDHPFTPAHVARLGDVSAIHSWIFNGTAQTYGGTSPQSRHHAEYLIELTRAFATDPTRQTWLQEVGAPSNCLTTAQMPDFMEHTIRNAATTEGLWGVTWWCSHDVDRSLADFPDLEYTLGLIDSERRIKPLGERFAEVIKDLRANPVSPATRKVAVEIEVDQQDTPLLRAALAPGGSLFDAWMGLVADGERPAFVLSSAGQHGFEEVVRVEATAPQGGYEPSNTEVEG